MPELPDVEGFRRRLTNTLPGRRVRHVEVRDAGVLRNTSPQSLGRALRGRRFDMPGRHGKWLILPTDGPTILVHSGMTGHPYYTSGTEPADGRVRLVVTLDRGNLRYADLRKLRGVWLATGDDDVARVTGPQGPDALDIDLPTFRDVLSARRGGLKATLLNQSVIAGLGNLLTDEICWQARLHPSRAITGLDGDEVMRMHATMRRVLRTAVRHGCVPALPQWLTGARDEPDPTCPRC